MKKVLKGICLLICLVGLIGCQPSLKEVDVTKHLKVEWYGVQGYAKFKVISNDLGIKKLDKEMKAFLESLTYEADKDAINKNNGEVTHITVKYDSDLAKKAKVKVINPTKKFTVFNIWEKEEIMIDGKKYYLVDGYEILADTVDSNAELYEEVVSEKAKAAARNTPEQPKELLWYQGEGTQDDLADQDHFIHFSDAYEYGNRTNKEFRIEQVFNDNGEITEYKVIFKK